MWNRACLSVAAATSAFVGTSWLIRHNELRDAKKLATHNSHAAQVKSKDLEMKQSINLSDTTSMDMDCSRSSPDRPFTCVCKVTHFGLLNDSESWFMMPEGTMPDTEKVCVTKQ